MENKYKRLSEIKNSNNWFGLPKENRVSIDKLVGIEIVMMEYLTTIIKGEEKLVVKFQYLDKPDEYNMFITKSGVIKDRLNKDKELLPFIATIKRKGRYYYYE